MQTFKLWLKTLEAKDAKEGVVLAENQLAVFEKAEQQKENYGEIETEHPGYLGAQNSFDAGMLKGIGLIYQQTFIIRRCFAKFYDCKSALVAADILNERVLPWDREH